MKRGAILVALVVGVAAVGSAVALSTPSHGIGRSLTMPAATALRLRGTGIRFRLAPPGAKPAIGAGQALKNLTSYLGDEHARPRALYLVLIKHNTKTWLAWMLVGHGYGPRERCP